METLKTTFCLLLLISCSTLSFGQFKKAKINKMDEAISSLKQTAFIQNYRLEIKAIDSLVNYFHMRKDEFSSDEVDLLKAHYKDSIEDFNQIANKLKKDLLDKQTRQFIIKDPEHYASNFDALLEKSLRAFDNNCAHSMEYLLDEDISAFGVMEFTILIGLVKEIAGMVGNMDTKMKKMDASYFEDNLVSEMRLKQWDEY